MSNTSKKIVSIIGIVIGVIIIIIGFSLQDTSNYSIGESIKFGADFYTEMYDVTKDVGRAINYAINDLICAIGWLIISLGAIDICFFVYKLVKASEVSAIEVKAKVQAEENVCQCGERFYGDTCPNCGRKAIIIQSTETRDNLRKATQCECGELHYARYCPICGKKAGASISNTEKPLKGEDKPQPKSTICKCGERFYGDICPNCGRNVKDI